MNSSRLLASVAALAVGFGITLVGAAMTDEVAETTTDVVDNEVSVPDATSDATSTPAGEVSTTVATTSSEPAPTTSSAPIVTTTTPPPPADDAAIDAPIGDDADDPASVPASTVFATEEEPTPDEGAIAEGPGVDEPVCLDVLVLPSASGLGADTVLVEGIDYEQVGNRYVVSAEYAEQFEAGVPDEQSVALIGDQVVSCPTGRPVQDPTVAATIGALFSWPCDSGVQRYFEGYFESLGYGSGAGYLPEEIVIEVVADRLAAADGRSGASDRLRDEVSEAFLGLREDCAEALDLDAIALAEALDGDEFFCVTAQLSADADLLDYLQSAAPAVVTSCVYEA